MSDRHDFVNKMKAKLDEWNAEIDKLEASAKSTRSEMSIKYEEEIENLKKRRDTAIAKLEELKSSGDVAWEDIKKGVEDAGESLSNALKSAASKFK